MDKIKSKYKKVLKTKSEWKCDSTRSFQLPLVKSASSCSTELDETEAAMILSSTVLFFRLWNSQTGCSDVPDFKIFFVIFCNLLQLQSSSEMI